jgi:LPXTG-site transpeptidase (sortase) family protein
VQNKNPKIVFTQREVEEYHRELLRAEARIRKNIFGVRKRRGLAEVGKFAATAAVIFAITFVGMNFSAFEKKASFLLSNLNKSEAVVEVAEQSSQLKITSPEIETAEQMLELPPLLGEIAPPDNRLIIKNLGIHAPIKTAKGINLNLGSWDDIEKQIQDALRGGVVSFPGTAKPGERGNAFITGHSSYYPIFPGRYKDVFALLPEIEVGEEIEIWQDQKKFTYRVNDKREVSPNATDVLDNTDDSRLTLMTCTPLGTALRRLIVTAQLEEV